jgi:hypothetical protein
MTFRFRSEFNHFFSYKPKSGTVLTFSLKITKEKELQIGNNTM